MDFLVGMMIRAEAIGALTLMDILRGHKLTLRDMPLKSNTVYQILGTCSWMAPKCLTNSSVRYLGPGLPA